VGHNLGVLFGRVHVALRHRDPAAHADHDRARGGRGPYLECLVPGAPKDTVDGVGLEASGVAVQGEGDEARLLDLLLSVGLDERYVVRELDNVLDLEGKQRSEEVKGIVDVDEIDTVA
jgi:hypothetical protein